MSAATMRVASADGRLVAEFVPAVGMICPSLRHDGDELLDPGKGLEAYAERGATMGIPLLYPWANRLASSRYAAAGRSVTLPDDRARIPVDPGGLPIHGAVPGLMAWETEPRGSDAALTARLAWRTPQLQELFPFEHEVTMAISAESESLTIATTVTAAGDQPVPVTFGFHPYLTLPGSSRRTWRLRLPAAERLRLDERMIPTGGREPAPEGWVDLAESSWDDGFALGAQPARYAVAADGRGIAVDLLEGFSYSQIYAPPERDFICFEPMTAPANALCSGDGLTVLAPGEQYRAVFRVSAWRD